MVQVDLSLVPERSKCLQILKCCLCPYFQASYDPISCLRKFSRRRCIPVRRQVSPYLCPRKLEQSLQAASVRVHRSADISILTLASKDRASASISVSQMAHGDHLRLLDDLFDPLDPILEAGEDKGTAAQIQRSREQNQLWPTHPSFNKALQARTLVVTLAANPAVILDLFLDLVERFLNKFTIKNYEFSWNTTLLAYTLEGRSRIARRRAGSEL